MEEEGKIVYTLKRAILFYLSLGIPDVTGLVTLLNVEYFYIVECCCLNDLQLCKYLYFFLVFCMDEELSKWSFPFQHAWKML